MLHRPLHFQFNSSESDLSGSHCIFYSAPTRVWGRPQAKPREAARIGKTLPASHTLAGLPLLFLIKEKYSPTLLLGRCSLANSGKVEVVEKQGQCQILQIKKEEISEIIK